jgi:outer membrane protein assembly factor BamA
MKRPLFVGASVSISVRILLGISLWFLMLTTQTQAQYGPLAGIKLLPENIHFVGNRAMTADDLRAIFRSAGTVTAKISAAQMDIYDTNRINLAIEMIQMFYRNRGFVKMTIELPEFSFLSGAFGGKSDSAAGKMELVIKISEKNLYHLGQIKVEGLNALQQNQVIAMLNLQQDMPINFSKLNAGTLALRETYLTLGYLDVAIQANLDAPDNRSLADLKISVVEGRQYHLGKIVLVGDSPIRESLLKESLPFQPGDVFGEKAFVACLETLNSLGTTPVLTADDVNFIYDKDRGIVDVSIYLQGKPKTK